MTGKTTALVTSLASLLIGCTGEVGPIDESEIDPPPPEEIIVPPDPVADGHTRRYPAACSEETISADGRDQLQRTFDGDDITSEALFHDEQAIATTSFAREVGFTERVAIQHQIATRFRTLEVYDGNGRVVEKKSLRGGMDSGVEEDRCLSIESFEYPEAGKVIRSIDDDCDGVDGTITTTRSETGEIIVRDEDGDGVSEVVTFNFFDDQDRQTRRVDLTTGNSTEWNWSRASEDGIEVVEYYRGAIGETLITRTETVRGQDGNPRSQVEYRALGETTITRSYDDYGNRLTEVARDGDGNQLAITTFRYDCL
jgi:hypothetical protein